MFITDSTTIETLTAAYTGDAVRHSIATTIHNTRTTREERQQWAKVVIDYEGRRSARMETIATIDRALARDITSAFHAVEDELWGVIAARFGVEGAPRDIITAMGEDYGDVYDVLDEQLEDMARAEAQRIVARHAAEEAR